MKVTFELLSSLAISNNIQRTLRSFEPSYSYPCNVFHTWIITAKEISEYLEPRWYFQFENEYEMCHQTSVTQKEIHIQHWPVLGNVENVGSFKVKYKYLFINF